jgi:hypothetical protein
VNEFPILITDKSLFGTDPAGVSLALERVTEVIQAYLPLSHLAMMLVMLGKIDDWTVYLPLATGAAPEVFHRQS